MDRLLLWRWLPCLILVGKGLFDCFAGLFNSFAGRFACTLLKKPVCLDQFAELDIHNSLIPKIRRDSLCLGRFNGGLPGSQSPISRPRAMQGRAPARRNRVLKRHGPQRGALGTGEEEGGRFNSPSFSISPGFNKRPASLPKRATRVQATVGTRSGLRKIKY